MIENVNFELRPLDLTIVGIYFVFVVSLGLYLSRKHESAEDYFLAGRSMLWPMIGLSLFASNISSTTLVGLAGDAYSTGISVFNYEWMAAVILVFFALFMLPSVLRSRVYTIPELLERRFDHRARLYFSALTIFLNILVDTAGTLYAGGLIIQLIFPQIPIWQTIAALAVVAGIYTAAGGLSAVIYTDALQAILLLMGSVLITFFALEQVGGWGNVVSQVSPEMLSLIRPPGDPGVPWPGLVTGVVLLGFYFWCTNQFMVQRLLSARDEFHGRFGALFAGFLKLPVLFIMVLPGTIAILIYPDLPKPDLVYPTLMFDLLPAGILGLVAAGFTAALMSQIDSTLNSASTLVTMDFVRRWKPELSPHRLMRVGQAVTVVFMFFAVLWAPQIENFGSLFKYLQKILSYAVAPVLSLFLVGFFWRRASASGAIVTLAVGTLAGLGLFVVVEVLGLFDLHFLYVAPLLFLLSSLVLVVVSLAKPDADSSGADAFSWSPELLQSDTSALNDTPWWRNYRLYSVLLLLLTAIIVFLFR